MKFNMKNMTLFIDGEPIGQLKGMSYAIGRGPSVSPEEQEALAGESSLIDKANAVRAEFLAENAATMKIAPDAEQGFAEPPAGVVTPSRLRAYYQARGVDVTVTLDQGRLLTEPIRLLEQHVERESRRKP